MKYLIDTHVCLWAVAEKQKLSNHVTNIPEDPIIEIFYSQVSLMEIAIKFKVGKLPDFEVSLNTFNDTLQQKGFKMMPVTISQLSAYFNCNFFSDHHRDPFDRCLLAIAYCEQLEIITKDEKYQLYSNIVKMFGNFEGKISTGLF